MTNNMLHDRQGIFADVQHNNPCYNFVTCYSGSTNDLKKLQHTHSHKTKVNETHHTLLVFEDDAL
jgi:hypothetical protein